MIARRDHPAGETPTLPEADESTTGPASLMLIDPDGNPVLIDQHVDSPPNLKNKTAEKHKTPPTPRIIDFLGDVQLH